MLYAKAKREGVLNKSFHDVQPKFDGGNKFHKEIWGYVGAGGESGNAMTDGSYSQSHATVRDALTTLARHNGYADLASAMTVSSSKPETAAKDAGRLLNMPLARHSVDALRHLAAKHPDIGKTSLKDLGMRTYRQNSHLNANDLSRTLDEMLPKFEEVAA